MYEFDRHETRRASNTVVWARFEVCHASDKTVIVYPLARIAVLIAKDYCGPVVCCQQPSASVKAEITATQSATAILTMILP